MIYPAFRRKSRVQPRFWLFVAVAFLMLLLVVAYFRYDGLYRQYRGELNTLREEVNEASIVNAQLERRLEFTRSSEFVEREARSQYGLIWPGEIRFEADVSAYSGVVAAWNSEETTTTISPFTQKTE